MDKSTLKNKYIYNFVRLKACLSVLEIDEDIKNNILAKVDQVSYLDKAVFGTSSADDQQTLYIHKFYKKLLKKHRSELFKLLNFYYNDKKNK